MRKENGGLSTWIVPRWAINAFTQEIQAIYEDGGRIFVSEVMPHDTLNYLVITHEGNEVTKANLHQFLLNLYQGDGN